MWDSSLQSLLLKNLIELNRNKINVLLQKRLKTQENQIMNEILSTEFLHGTGCRTELYSKNIIFPLIFHLIVLAVLKILYKTNFVSC